MGRLPGLAAIAFGIAIGLTAAPAGASGEAALAVPSARGSAAPGTGAITPGAGRPRLVTLINGGRLLAGAEPGGGISHELIAGTARGVNAALVSTRQIGVFVTPFSDNTFGDVGSGYAPIPHVTFSGQYQIDENGKKIAGGGVIPKGGYRIGFGTAVPVSAKPSVIRFLLTATRQGSAYPLSSASRTVWTWRSAHEAGQTVPPGWECLTRVAITRSCAAEPMMTLRYAVAGLALDGSAPAARQVLRVTAGHLQLVKSITVTRASVSVSFDGGKTWHPAHVTGRGRRYTATFTAPASATVSLRTSAADAAGGSITETITSAYRTSS